MSSQVLAKYVRPIYDAIDQRQYKPALKLCGHKKVAHLDVVQVLKAHCLERLGKADEALAICRGVQAKNPLDDTLLNTMYLVFRLAGSEHEMLPTFEYACAHSKPPNEELHISLFCAYARQNALLKQQQVALKMVKVFQSNPVKLMRYTCWAALSMILQVKQGLAPPQLLKLAERMLVKTAREVSPSCSIDGEALQLILKTLEEQQLHDNALILFDEFIINLEDNTTSENTNKVRKKTRALEGEGVSDEDIELGPMQLIDQLAIEASMTKNVGQFSRAEQVYSTLLLEHDADDWTFLTNYIDTKLQQSASIQTFADECDSFFTQLQEHKDENKRIRGPMLARVHVQYKILVQIKEGGEAGELSARDTETALYTSIINYIDQFYTKTCCFTDITQYLALFQIPSDDTNNLFVSTQTREKFIAYILNMAEKSHCADLQKESSEKLIKNAIHQLSKRLLSLKLARYLQVYQHLNYSDSQMLAIARDFVSEYDSISWVNTSSNSTQREVQPTDDFLLIAVYIILDICNNELNPNNCRNLLVESASILEYGLMKSPFNFQMKLLLSRIYGYLGASDAMLKRYIELDIKHIQMDSLSYLVLDKLIAFGYYAEAEGICRKIQRVHSSAQADTPEYITRAYRMGVYSKVLDMSDFIHSRMKKSQTLAISLSYSLVQFQCLDLMTPEQSTKLYDVAISKEFAEKIQSLEQQLGIENFCRNQHRDICVRWTAGDIIPIGDEISPNNHTFIEYDRSVDLDRSRQWIELGLIIAKLFRVAGNGETELMAELQNLGEKYNAIISNLTKLKNDEVTSKSLYQRIWQWSVHAVNSTIVFLNLLFDHQADNSWETAVKTIASLEEQIIILSEDLFKEILISKEEDSNAPIFVSTYGLSCFSQWLGESGLWSLCLLVIVLRSLGKKKSKGSIKKQVNACYNAIRSLLKHVVECSNTLESQIESITFENKEMTPAENLQDENEIDLTQAKVKVLDQVYQSNLSLQVRLIELLHNRVGGLKAVLQKY